MVCSEFMRAFVSLSSVRLNAKVIVCRHKVKVEYHEKVCQFISIAAVSGRADTVAKCGIDGVGADHDIGF